MNEYWVLTEERQSDSIKRNASRSTELIFFVETSKASGQSTAAFRRLRQMMRKHPLFFFFLMAYAFSWIVFIPYMLSEWGILQGDYHPFYVIHTFGPALAAIVMISIVEGRAGLLGFWQRIRQWRASWQWYLFILLGIPALVMLGVIIQPGALANFKGLTPLLPVSYLLWYVAVFFLGGPLGEEPGWRGFALPRMQPRYGPLWGTLFLGVLWAFWHLPDFLTASKGGGPGTGFATFLTNFPIFMLAVVSLAVIMTWIFNHTRGSIFTAVLAHASVNTPEAVLIPLFPAMDMISLHLASLIGFGVPAMLIVILTRGRLGYEPSQATALRPGEIEAKSTL
jgi:membrane protease YdiL (CAAX protease family)